MSSWLRIALSLSLFVLASACGPRKTLPDLGPVPAFSTLTRETGEAFSSDKELRGKVWIADFIFTNCPGPCPRLTQHMKHLQDQLTGLDSVRFVSFTVDPERDTPPVLAAYAKRFGADPMRWYFLTGPRNDLHHLSKDVFKLGDVAPDLEHSTRFVLVDKRSRIRGYYGTSDPQQGLVEAVQDAIQLAKEK